MGEKAVGFELAWRRIRHFSIRLVDTILTLYERHTHSGREREIILSTNIAKRHHIQSIYFPFHPIGINAAAISETPRSVANRLNCAAAFLVSSTSTRTPCALICFLVSRDSGIIEEPVPTINRSKNHRQQADL